MALSDSNAKNEMADPGATLRTRASVPAHSARRPSLRSKEAATAMAPPLRMPRLVTAAASAPAAWAGSVCNRVLITSTGLVTSVATVDAAWHSTAGGCSVTLGNLGQGIEELRRDAHHCAECTCVWRKRSLPPGNAAALRCLGSEALVRHEVYNIPGPPKQVLRPVAAGGGKKIMRGERSWKPSAHSTVRLSSRTQAHRKMPRGPSCSRMRAKASVLPEYGRSAGSLDSAPVDCCDSDWTCGQGGPGRDGRAAAGRPAGSEAKPACRGAAPGAAPSPDPWG